MTEREMVLLQREAVRRWYREFADDTRPDDEDEAALRRLFPLPPKREPRVVRGQIDGRLFRIDWNGNFMISYNDGYEWEMYMARDAAEAFRTLLASPYIEVPDPEDAPA